MKKLFHYAVAAAFLMGLSIAQAGDLFDAEWMAKYATEWNNDPQVSGKLAKIDFTSNIGYGFKGDDEAKGVLVIENGVAVRGSSYNGEKLDWDLRADEEDWEKWMEEGISMMSLGGAYMWGTLKFAVGDYYAMIKSPSMAGPFIESFSVMGRVK